MLGLVLAIAEQQGDLETISHGTVSMEYAERIENLTNQLKAEEIGIDEGEQVFNQIWDEVAAEFDLNREECMLNLDRNTGEVEEIVILDAALHEALVHSGKPARMKSAIK